MAAPTETKSTEGTEKRNVGRIEEIQGVVIEAVFPEDLPEIYSALLVKREGLEPATRTSAPTSSARSSSTSATTACARSPWTRRTASPAAPR